MLNSPRAPCSEFALENGAHYEETPFIILAHNCQISAQTANNTKP